MLTDAKTRSLQEFAEANSLIGLSEESLEKIHLNEEGYTVEKGQKFLRFQERIKKELLTHKVITNNEFTKWFAKAEINDAQCKAFIVQFSVFSNLFLIAQLHKMINSPNLECLHASKEILANEIGVLFRNPAAKTKLRKSSPLDKDAEGDPELVSTEGTIQGGVFKYEAAHFEWLYKMAGKLGLGFNDIGKRKHGTKSTLFFCDELVRLYGNENYDISCAASYAVENWAAAGFWTELTAGLKTYRDKYCTDLPLAFFTWHDKLESQHAAHTQEELEEYYFEYDLHEDNFIKYANEMLNAVLVFWEGLDEQRKQL